MKNIDTRVQYTKNALKTALLSIMKTKPISKITIKELCDEAGLNRGTFYLHYMEPNDVLREIEDEFMRDHLNLFAPYIETQHDTIRLSDLFTCMIQNKELCLILMGHNGAPQFMERIKNAIWPTLLADWQQEFPEYTIQDLELVHEFTFPGATQMLLRWMRDDAGLSAEQIARRLDRLGHYCHLAIREF